MCVPERTFAPPKPYTSRQEADGTYSIFDVEVFGAVAKDAHGCNPEIDDDFLLACLNNYTRRLVDGYSPPLHVEHHYSGETVERAGEFRLKRVQVADYAGGRIPILFADFLRVPEAVFQRIARGDIPYRSVEVDYETQEIQSIALLAHDAPFFKFRNLTVAPVEGVAGFAADGDSTSHGFFAYRPHKENVPMPETTPKTKTDPAPFDAEAFKATITAEINTRFDALDAKLASFSAAAPAAPKAEPKPETTGDEATVELAKLEGRFAALEGRLDQRDKKDEAKAKAEAAIAQFKADGYNVSSENVAKFHAHAEKGDAALAAFSEGFAEMPKDPPASWDAAQAAAGGVEDPIFATFSAQGPAALAAAREADAMYQPMKNVLGVSRENYLKRHVERALKGEE